MRPVCGQVVIFRRNLQYGLAGLPEMAEEYVFHGAMECLGNFEEQQWTGRICFSGPGQEEGDEPESEAAWKVRMENAHGRPIECRVGDDVMNDE